MSVLATAWLGLVFTIVACVVVGSGWFCLGVVYLRGCLLQVLSTAYYLLRLVWGMLRFVNFEFKMVFCRMCKIAVRLRF